MYFVRHMCTVPALCSIGKNDTLNKYSDLSGQESEAEGNSSAPKRAEASEKI